MSLQSSEEKELELLKTKYDFTEPNRGNLDDPSIIWRNGKPNYTKANLQFFKGKSMNHKAGSLSQIVEDLVKTWEMEASHKADFWQWTTVEHDVYRVSANGGRICKGEEAKEIGNYNWLLEACPKDLYDSTKESFESSHDIFRGCFVDGFPWELIEVFSGPPVVVFSWRHWGIFKGVYRDNKGDGQTVEMFGLAVVTVNDKLKVQNIEIYYKPNEFLEVLEGKRANKDIAGGKSIVGPGCPFIHLSEKK